MCGIENGKVWEVSGMKAEYDALLKTGMFFEFYPDLIGEWEKDKDQWRKIYRKLKKSRR